MASAQKTAGDPAMPMRVVKRDGRSEAVDVGKIVRAVSRCAVGLTGVDPMRVATKTIGGLYDGATTAELDRLSIQTAAGLIFEEPEYSKLAARLLGEYIDKEVRGHDIQSFSQAVAVGHKLGLIAKTTAELVATNARKLNAAVSACDNSLFEFFGIRTVYDRYLLRHPTGRRVIETPTYFMMRVACGLADTAAEAVELFRLMVTHRYMPSTPTLFNSGTPQSQMSSCYLLDSPADDLDAIYLKYLDVAKLSKFAGGIGLAFHRVRSDGSLIVGTNGQSNGVVPFVKVLDSSVGAVNQGGRRKGAACVYLECWHADIEQFLELKDNTGDQSRRTYNLNIANWVPDLFMRRVEAGQDWSLFDPKTVPVLCDLYGDEFDAEYVAAEKAGLAVRTVPARDLYARMMKTLAETGNGWMNFKDACNRLCNQTGDTGAVVHCSNLCVTGDQRVVSDRGLKTARQLHEEGGDLTLFDGERSVLASAMKLIERDAPVYRITLDNGMTHTVTGYHKVKVRTSPSGWPLTTGNKTCDDLRPGDMVAVQTKKGLFGAVHRPQEAFLLGMYHGDGTQTDKVVAIDLWEHDFDLVEEIETAFAGVCERHKLSTDVYGRVRQTVSFHDCTADASPVRKKRLVGTALKKFGFRKGLIPDWVWEGDEATQWQYVRGLLYTDGTVHIGRGNGEPLQLSLASVDRGFLTDVQLMFANLGLSTSIRIVRNGGPTVLPDGRGGRREYQSRPIWRLIVGNKTDAIEIERNTGFLSRKGVAVEVRDYRDNSKKFYAVVSVEQTGREDVFCCTVDSDDHYWVCNGVITHNCTEIVEVTSAGETAVCNLGSPNLATHVVNGEFDFRMLADTVRTAVKFLDRVIDRNFYPTDTAAASNAKWRPVGLGVMGLQDVFFQLRLPFDSPAARELSKRIQEEIYFAALSTSCELAERHGPHDGYEFTRIAAGKLQFDLWGVSPTDPARWDALRQKIAKHGLRNSLLIAVAPTATIASIVGCYECTEPQVSNLFKRETLSGEFLQVNRYLVADLKAAGLWTDAVRDRIKVADGSVQGLPELSAEMKAVYRTVWEVPMRSLIDMAADRGPFIDQSQSLNLFMESPTIGKMSSMYMHAWKRGLKTTYYLRSRPASAIAKTTVAASPTAAVACSLANPETCESCQ